MRWSSKSFDNYALLHTSLHSDLHKPISQECLRGLIKMTAQIKSFLRSLWTSRRKERIRETRAAIIARRYSFAWIMLTNILSRLLRGKLHGPWDNGGFNSCIPLRRTSGIIKNSSLNSGPRLVNILVGFRSSRQPNWTGFGGQITNHFKNLILLKKSFKIQ